MHELHLAEDILRKIKEKARQEEKGSLRYVKVAIGQSRFTHMEELKELLADISKDTVADGATIEFEVIPLRAACADCRREFDPEQMRLDCPGCGSTNIRVASGNELFIKEIK